MCCVYYPGEPIPRAGSSCLELMFMISWWQDTLKALKSILKVACNKMNNRQVRNAESGKKIFPREEPLIDCPILMVSPESIHTSNVQTEQIIVRSICVYTYVCNKSS